MRSAAPIGHHTCFQPSSVQRLRIRGMTSSAKSVVFFTVRSWGIEPICSRAWRLPNRRVLAASMRRSATVAGLPAMMKPLSMSAFQSFSRVSIFATSSGWLVLMANSVLRRVR